jgi:hypothetical protein
MPIQSIKSGTLSRSTAVGNAIILPGDFESIATVTVGSPVSTITFSSIPSTYTHLQIRALAKTNKATDNADDVFVRFNSDTTDNYPFHRLRGNGATVDAAGDPTGSGFTNILIPTCVGVTSKTNVFGAIVIDILDYANTNKYKTLRALSGMDANEAPAWASLSSGLWMNSAAISTVALTPGAGTTFSQYSHFALYGIRG